MRPYSFRATASVHVRNPKQTRYVPCAVAERQQMGRGRGMERRNVAERVGHPPAVVGSEAERTCHVDALQKQARFIWHGTAGRRITATATAALFAHCLRRFHLGSAQVPDQAQPWLQHEPAVCGREHSLIATGGPGRVGHELSCEPRTQTGGWIAVGAGGADVNVPDDELLFARLARERREDLSARGEEAGVVCVES